MLKEFKTSEEVSNLYIDAPEGVVVQDKLLGGNVSVALTAAAACFAAAGASLVSASYAVNVTGSLNSNKKSKKESSDTEESFED